MFWGGRGKAYFISQCSKSLSAAPDLKRGGLNKESTSNTSMHLQPWGNVVITTSQADLHSSDLQLHLPSTSPRSGSWSCPRLVSDGPGDPSQAHGAAWQLSFPSERSGPKICSQHRSNYLTKEKKELIPKVKLLHHCCPHMHSSTTWKILRSSIFKLYK